MSNATGYPTERFQNQDAIVHLFISRGKADIIKAVQYYYVQDFLGCRLYNLAFGDYDISADRVLDSSDSNNGDVYPVLRTVLATMETFFDSVPNAMLIVQGSDSTPEFEALCRDSCRRHCEGNCKRRGRRINIYRAYLNKNFPLLDKRFVFYGGLDAGGKRVVEAYEPDKAYGAVFLRKR